MPSKSVASSVDAQNGSSYDRSNVEFTSQESHLNSTNSPDYAQYPQYPVGVPQNCGATTTAQGTCAIADDQSQIGYTNGHGDDNSYNSYTNGDYSQSASSYHTHPPSHQPQDAQLDAQGYQRYRHYYLPPTAYTQETPNYDPEIVIDSIEDEQGSPQYSVQPEPGSSRAQSQQPSAACRTPQNPQRSSVARTPTVRRWSREYSPEERMRVGLPRRETDYEREQRQGRRRS